MADATPAVQLHHLADSRFSLAFITDEKTERIRKTQVLTEDLEGQRTTLAMTGSGSQMWVKAMRISI